MDRFSGQIVLAVIIGVIVGFALGVVWQNSISSEGKENLEETQEQGVTEEQNESTSDSVVSEETRAGFGSVEVSNQSAGKVVQVENVSIDGTGWVAIREVGLDGELQNILGAVYIESGVHENLPVPLLRRTEEGNNYAVVLFSDDGDHIFNHTSDAMLENDGNLILATFNTQSQ